jgi:transposase
MDETEGGGMMRIELEARRLRAVPDLQSSISCGVLGKRYGVSRTTICRWRAALASGASLVAQRTPGRPRRLTLDDERKVELFFRVGPCILLGIDSERWTQARFADAIKQELGIEYSPDHMGRIMHRLGLGTKREYRRAGALASIDQ